MRGVAPEASFDSVFTLETSKDLEHWMELAVLHPRKWLADDVPSFAFADFASSNALQRFYRFSTAPLQVGDDWKNQVHFPEDTFLTLWFTTSTELWIKFIILTNEPARVFYATNSYLFHYDFAVARLDPFRGMSPLEFDRQTQLENGRRAWLGSVLYPRYTTAEYGIQFVSQDVLPRERVRDLFELVKSTIITPRPLGTMYTVPTAFYIPTFEQSANAEVNRAYFAANGIPVSNAARWARGDVCYSEGWGIGQLKFFTVSDINAAYADGRLGPKDILLTDGIPAELPYVSGIVSLIPSTANSHVAILARSYGVPFVYLVSDTERLRVMELVNREVIVQAAAVPYLNACRATVVALDETFDPVLRAEITGLRAPPPIEITPKQFFGAYTISTDGLYPEDIRYFGGKAANYGVLRRAIPDNVPVAIAISFDLWDEFMSQVMSTGRTLRQEISNRLAGFTYPPNVAALQSQLAAIRTLIRNSTQFTPAQQQAIIAALAIFDPRRNIRFRSSTNVEDAESFSGAGLYDSFSGCLADDLDSDTAGPSICDPTETGERGVFRAIRRVFSSFYNDNAYLERLRHNVDENTVGMAMLVHHSTPDDIEMANGVATLSSGAEQRGRLVTQKGAVSVANPDGSAIPEEVLLRGSGEFPTLDVAQFSSLLPMGDHVLNWQDEYYDLCHLLFQAESEYRSIVNSANTLDFEYKKVSPGTLEIKQVRQIPAVTSSNITPYLLNQPTTFVTYQGYYARIWATHHLKSRWTINTRNMQLTESNIQNGLFTDLTIEHLDGTNIVVLSGPISSFPNATSDYTGWRVRNAWSMTSSAGPVDVALSSSIDNAPVTTLAPFKTALDFPRFSPSLEAHFHIPVPFNDNVLQMQLVYVTNDFTFLRPLLTETTRDVLKEFTFNIRGQGTNAIIHTSYWMGTMENFGETPPLIRFVETRIEGFTSEPIVLRSYWSQTFSVVHAGRENFVFEPRLEPGLSAAQLNELAAADIALLYLNNVSYYYADLAVLKIIGRNGAVRTFSDEDFP